MLIQQPVNLEITGEGRERKRKENTIIGKGGKEEKKRKKGARKKRRKKIRKDKNRKKVKTRKDKLYIK